MTWEKLKQLTKRATRNGANERFQQIKIIFFHTASLGWWSNIGKAHIIFHNLVAK